MVFDMHCEVNNAATSTYFACISFEGLEMRFGPAGSVRHQMVVMGLKITSIKVRFCQTIASGS
jgi:hypothetical protein